MKLVLATIEWVGAWVIAWGALRGFAVLIQGGRNHQARRIVADAAVMGMSIKLIATLLKTIELRGWGPIGSFAAILAIRTILQADFRWVGSEEAPPSLGNPGGHSLRAEL